MIIGSFAEIDPQTTVSCVSLPLCMSNYMYFLTDAVICHTHTHTHTHAHTHTHSHTHSHTFSDCYVYFLCATCTLRRMPFLAVSHIENMRDKQKMWARKWKCEPNVISDWLIHTSTSLVHSFLHDSIFFWLWHTHTHVYIYAWRRDMIDRARTVMYSYINIYVYMCICIHIYVYIYLYMIIYVYICMQDNETLSVITLNLIHRYLYVCIPVYMYTRKHNIYIYIYIHTHICRRTRRYQQAHSFWCKVFVSSLKVCLYIYVRVCVWVY